MRLLLVGPLDGQIYTAGQIAHAHGARVTQVASIIAALAALRSGQGGDVVMIDIACDVASFVKALRGERIMTPVVACGIGTDTAAAVKAIKAGAREYIPLPPDAKLIAAVLQAVAEETSAIIHADPAFDQLLKLADQIAPSEASVLVLGESGTGKEVLARYLHQHSRRSQQRFVALNCAAIPENLLESELFGHEKGAFTGAVARRLGKFEEAHGGSLLLDEISEMDIRLQAKLLRAIQEREIDRLGGGGPVKVDIRLIATSNRDLVEEVRHGRFREDLFYRLSVVTLTLPPLRERPTDIPVLADHFARKYAEINELPLRPIGQGARDKLRRHPWHGNVRELENTIHRAVLIAAGDEIDSDSIILAAARTDSPQPSATQTMTGSASPLSALDGASLPPALVGRTVADVECGLIIDTLRHCLGNRTHAATILGISIRTLRNKLKLYASSGINVPVPNLGHLNPGNPHEAPMILHRGR